MKKYIKFILVYIFLVLTGYKVISDISLRIERKKTFTKLHYEIQTFLQDYKEEVGYVIKDLKTNTMVSHNIDKIFQSASLVKLPLMICLLQAEKEGHINLYQKITLEKYHKAPGSGILKYYQPKQMFTIDSLIELMITRSDNTATNMLTELLGFNYINFTFRKLGLKVTNFDRKILDFNAIGKGIENYTTPREISWLLEMVYRKKIISKYACEYMLSILKKQCITDRIPRYLPKDLEIAHKTGLMKKACHDAGIIFSDKGDILICVLTSNINPKIAKRIIGAIAYKTYAEL